MEAIGQKVDAAVIFGDNRPREWQADLVTLARQAGNNVSPAAGKDYYDLILGENGVFAKVEEDGYGVSGAIAAMNFKAKSVDFATPQVSRFSKAICRMSQDTPWMAHRYIPGKRWILS